MHLYGQFLIVLSLCVDRLVLCKPTPDNLRDSNLIVGSIGFKRLSQLTELCEVNNDFLFRTNEVQLRMNLEVFECLSKIKLNGTIKTTTLTSLSVKQWVLWEVDRFNLKEPVNWIPGTLSTCGNSNDSFLGGHCNLGSGSVKRIYTNIPTHSELKVSGRVHFFDQWNGESVSLKVNDKILWTGKDGGFKPSESYDWCPSVTDSACRKFGIDVCGLEYPDRLSVLAGLFKLCYLISYFNSSRFTSVHLKFRSTLRWRFLTRATQSHSSL